MGPYGSFGGPIVVRLFWDFLQLKTQIKIPIKLTVLSYANIRFNIIFITTSMYFSLSAETEDVIDKEGKSMALITIRIIFSCNKLLGGGGGEILYCTVSCERLTCA